MEIMENQAESKGSTGGERRSRGSRDYFDSGGADLTCCDIQVTAYKPGRDHFREDHKREQRYLKGEVTVYLSLVFILLMSFTGAMLESASSQNVKNYRRADMNRAVESLFAEYQKELWEVYGIFALEGSYETGTYNEELLMDRLAYYGAGGIDQEITKIQLLTDRGASAFYDQVTAYMENKYGLDRVKKYVGQTDTWKAGQEAEESYEKDGTEKEQELQGVLSEREVDLPEEDNPLSHVAKLKSIPLLELIMPKEKTVSSKRISLSEMVSHRKCNQGYGDFSDVEGSEGTVNKLLFGEYVLEHFLKASDSQADSGKMRTAARRSKGNPTGKTGALDYELEYILEGKASDRENLEAVAGRILMMRFVPDYAYIRTDVQKKAEAKAMAAALCTVIALPEIAEVVAQGILLAWAYGEAVMDLRTLIGGGKVPLVKTAEDWKLSLSGLMQLGTEDDTGNGGAVNQENGLAYGEYLRMLLFLKPQNELGMRTLDMIEQNLKIRYGQDFFRADACVSRIEFHSTCRIRRGVTYDFPTYFGYN